MQSQCSRPSFEKYILSNAGSRTAYWGEMCELGKGLLLKHICSFVQNNRIGWPRIVYQTVKRTESNG